MIFMGPKFLTLLPNMYKINKITNRRGFGPLEKPNYGRLRIMLILGLVYCIGWAFY